MIELLGQLGRVIVALILLEALESVLLFLHEILFPFLLAGFLSYVLASVIKRIKLREICYGYPLSRSSSGTARSGA